MPYVENFFRLENITWFQLEIIWSYIVLLRLESQNIKKLCYRNDHCFIFRCISKCEFRIIFNHLFIQLFYRWFEDNRTFWNIHSRADCQTKPHPNLPGWWKTVPHWNKKQSEEFTRVQQDGKWMTINSKFSISDLFVTQFLILKHNFLNVLIGWV